MKTNILILTILIVLGSITNMISQDAPQGFNYQGVARDADNEPFLNQQISLRITITAENNSNIVYSERHVILTSDLGIFNVVIGKGENISGQFNAIDWGDSEYLIKTDIDPNGGSNYLTAGQSKLYSVPYALYAANGGEPGPQGEKGDRGERGEIGPKGDQGVTGERGERGERGEKGEKGDPGEKGDSGETGPRGDQGEDGPRGDKGDSGEKGDKGDRGDKGDPGEKGDDGDPGEKGERGDKGDDGEKGDKGDQGDKGDRGDKGDIGPKGDSGEKGDKGDQGDQGVEGLRGERGETGAKGDDGERGQQGEMGVKGDKGDRGDKGDKGDKGDQGSPGTNANSVWSEQGGYAVYSGDGAQIGNSSGVHAHLEKDGLHFHNGGSLYAMQYGATTLSGFGSSGSVEVIPGQIATTYSGRTTVLNSEGLRLIPSSLPASLKLSVQSGSIYKNQLSVGWDAVSVADRLSVGSHIELGSFSGGTLVNGMIEYYNGDLRGYVGGSWKSLTQSGGGGAFAPSGANGIFQGSGRVGIGIGSPSEKLHVIGDILASVDVEAVDDLIAGDDLLIGDDIVMGGVRVSPSSSGNSLFITGNLHPIADVGHRLGQSSNRWSIVYARDGVVTTSDKNLKKNIEKLNYGLSDVMKLEPVQFQWNSGEDQEGLRLGFLAQDLLDVIPDVVVTHEYDHDPNDGTYTKKSVEKLGVRYAEIIPVLTSAIQEQQLTFTQQKQELKDLKYELEALKAQVKELMDK